MKGSQLRAKVSESCTKRITAVQRTIQDSAIRKQHDTGRKKMPSGVKRPTRRSSGSSAKRLPLIQEFQEIIRTAQLNATTPSTETKSEMLSASPLKGEFREKLDNTCTEARPENLDESLDHMAPSPITPSLPRGLMLQMEGSVAFSSQSSGDSYHHVTQSVLIKQELCEADDADHPFADASESSFNENGRGLDLDELLDELFEDGSKSTSPDEEQSKPTSPPLLSELDYLNLSLERNDAPPQVDFIKAGINSSEQEESDFACRQSPSVAQDDCTPKIANVEGQVDAQPIIITEAFGSASSKEECLTSAVNICEITYQSKEALANNDTATDLSNRKFNGEPWKYTSDQKDLCEDLALSHSQIVNIDAKCNAMSKAPEEIVPSASVKHTLDEKITSSVTSQMPNKAPSITFSIPPAPHMDWMHRTAECQQRLRTITKEISRLNAMVLRARRMLWPRQQSTPLPGQAHHSNEACLQPMGLQHSEQFRFPNAFPEPEWNIS